MGPTPIEQTYLAVGLSFSRLPFFKTEKSKEENEPPIAYLAY
jgi:hypothetical protein